MWALRNLLEYQVFGERARVQQFQANMMYVMACGNRLDKDRAKPFGDTLGKIYASPFRVVHRQTGEEIVNMLLGD